MRPLRQLCAVALLTTILALSVFADDGQMQTPATVPPPLTETLTTGGDPGEADSVMQALLNILHGLIVLV